MGFFQYMMTVSFDFEGRHQLITGD